jgi:hypothetical protein
MSGATRCSTLGEQEIKPNWSCTTCGMYSGRRDCVQRHINNLHMGFGFAIPFVEYLVGRRNGWYPPGSRPSFGPKVKSLREEMKEEVRKVFIKRVAEQFLPPSWDPKYRECTKDLKNCFYDSTSQEFKSFD